MQTVNLPYRPNVCLLILNTNKQILVGQRLNNPGVWQLPQGGLEEGHDLESDQVLIANALREAAEELGVGENSFRFKAILSARHQYDYRNTPDYAVGVFRGQSQRFVVLDFIANPEILTPEKSDDPEFSEFDWVEIDNVLAIVEERRRVGYVEALEELNLFLLKT